MKRASLAFAAAAGLAADAGRLRECVSPGGGKVRLWHHDPHANDCGHPGRDVSSTEGTGAAREGSSTRALILRGVKEVLKTERRKALVPVSLPIVPSKRPGTVAIDNARIYDLAFP